MSSTDYFKSMPDIEMAALFTLNRAPKLYITPCPFAFNYLDAKDGKQEMERKSVYRT